MATPPTGFEGQDVDFGRDALAQAGLLAKVGGGVAGFDFTKLDAAGLDLLETAASWTCVRDNHTGLTWEVKSSDGGLRDQGWTYSWYNSDPASNGGAVGYLDPDPAAGCNFKPDPAMPWYSSSDFCGGTLANCNTEAYREAVNQAGLCGTNDWRLPSTEELQSLVDYGQSGSALDTSYFPDTSGKGGVWSSSPDAYYPDKAWEGGYGSVYYRYRYCSFSVRLVRGGQQ